MPLEWMDQSIVVLQELATRHRSWSVCTVQLCISPPTLQGTGSNLTSLPTCNWLYFWQRISRKKEFTCTALQKMFISDKIKMAALHRAFPSITYLAVEYNHLRKQQLQQAWKASRQPSWWELLLLDRRLQNRLSLSPTSGLMVTISPTCEQNLLLSRVSNKSTIIFQ